MKSVLLYFLIILLLLLTSFNIKNYLTPVSEGKFQKVLGIQTKEDGAQGFWNEFVNKNPNYIPGWIEVGRTDKAKEIDPNFMP